MSSAILYVAIVAIWACVLIPRWLRRDSSLPVASDPSAPAEEQADGDVTTAAEAGEEPDSPSRRHRLRRRDARREDRARKDTRREDRHRDGHGDAARERRQAPVQRSHVPDDLAHRRVLSARRRLLAMLLVLTTASGVLAGLRLAAWWVVLPSSVMLLIYLVLLREAGKADVRRRELAREWAARAAATEVRHAAGAAGEFPAPRARVIDISASRAPGGRGGRDELYDQDEDAKLRAVGD